MKNLYLGSSSVSFNDDEFEDLETVDIKYGKETLEGKRFQVTVKDFKYPIQLIVPIDNFAEV